MTPLPHKSKVIVSRPRCRSTLLSQQCWSRDLNRHDRWGSRASLHGTHQHTNRKMNEQSIPVSRAVATQRCTTAFCTAALTWLEAFSCRTPASHLNDAPVTN